MPSSGTQNAMFGESVKGEGSDYHETDYETDFTGPTWQYSTHVSKL